MAAISFLDPSAAEFRVEVRAWLEATWPGYKNTAGTTGEDELALRRGWEKELSRAGYNCLSWPSFHGGRGLGPVEEFIFAEESIAVGAPEGIGRVGWLLAYPALAAHGSPEQIERFLPRILNADDIWCQGFSEPNAGSDLANVRTTARRVENVYRVNGQKVWTSFGHYADWCLLLARTGDVGARHRGLTMFAMPMHQAGVRSRPIRQIDGRSDFNEVFYADAEVDLECRLGEEGDGWRVAMTILTAERGAGFAALAMGRIVDMMRTLYHCASARPRLEAEVAALDDRRFVTRWQVMRAIERMAADRDAVRSSSLMKLAWSELTQDIARCGCSRTAPNLGSCGDLAN